MSIVSPAAPISPVRSIITEAPAIAGSPAGPSQYSEAGAKWPDLMAAEAMHGLAGDFVRAISPHSEADDVALLIQFLAGVGNAIGYSPYAIADGGRHGANINAVLVGESSKSRKGTSWQQVRNVLKGADPTWASHIASGLSSGEGIIFHVRDPLEKNEPVKERGKILRYERNIVDEGVQDKRLFVQEGEFASVLKVALREGNTLSPVIRNAWDNGDLQTLTKNSPTRSTGAHISIIGHITRDELLRNINDTEAANGFGNRFLWLCVRRSKCLPEGGMPDPAILSETTGRVRAAIEHGRTVTEIRRNDEARAIWREVYPALSEGRPGLLGAMVNRSESQVLRLSIIYALLDCSPVIAPEHLSAALAVWEYAEASAKFIFGDKLGDPVADAIHAALHSNPQGMTRTDIRNLFSRHAKESDVDRALAALLARGMAASERRQTGGRPTDVWRLRTFVA